MANASRAVLDGAQLPVANLRGAVLSAASLEGAKLPGANLEGARLPMANLRDADLTRSEASGAHFQRVILYDANLTGASLGGVELSDADLSGAQLPLADLEGARLSRSRLSGADLSQVNLRRACLKGADFSKADLTGASLVEAELVETNFGGAKLARCQLSRALFVGCNLEQAVLRECRVDDITLSGIRHDGVVTANLALTPSDEAAILVDDLEMVKLLETLLVEPRWRDLIAPNALRMVVVLGRFPEWRRPHLDAIRDQLRGRHYAPVAIDLEHPVGPKLRAVIENLAHLARFIIADLAGSREFMNDIQPLGPNLRGLPLQAIMPEGEELMELPSVWGKDPYRYRDTDHLVHSFAKSVLQPLEQKLAPVS
jgi:uncharacterized protein YjbI with pentapeptide repeats